MKRQLLLLPLFSVVACSAANDGSLPTTPNAPIFSASTQSVIFEESGGGFIMQLPTDAPCRPLAATYTLTIASHTVAITGCFDKGQSSEARTATKVLDAAAWQPVQAGLAALRVGSIDSCGADKGGLTITVATDSAQQVYKDNFYACSHAGVYFDSNSAIALQSALSKLSQP